MQYIHTERQVLGANPGFPVGGWGGGGLWVYMQVDQVRRRQSCILPMFPRSLLKLKACLHVPSTFPCQSPSPSKFIIVSMETDRLMDRMGSVPILPIKQTITIGIMLYFDGDRDGHRDGDGTCKQAFGHATSLYSPPSPSLEHGT